MVLHDFDFILFGGTSDVAMRKLLPALYARDVAGNFPDTAKIICLGRHDVSQTAFLKEVRERANIPTQAQHTALLEKFYQRIIYIALEATQEENYIALAKAIRHDESITRVFYFATPSNLFGIICHHLASVKLIHENTRVVLEKPIGHDLHSAQCINTEVGKFFKEAQIFRIDHYLGKETVQNLLALRFANILFEPLWRREWISNIQITIAENLGAGKRAQYYDNAGALRDMLQNHLLQLLCIVAMEPPSSIAPDAIRDEKLQVLHSLKRFTPASLKQDIVRGQYISGHIDGIAVPGYVEELNTHPASHTETFVALKTEIDTWRWAGVPFYLRTGKRMEKSIAQIVVCFKAIPHSIFTQSSKRLQPNTLVIRLQPDDGLTLTLMAKTPGDTIHLHPVDLNLAFAEIFKQPRIQAYERLLLDVLRNNLTLFMRSDELEAAWEWLEPVIQHWQHNQKIPEPYKAGSWGPESAHTLIARDGFKWHEEI